MGDYFCALRRAQGQNILSMKNIYPLLKKIFGQGPKIPEEAINSRQRNNGNIFLSHTIKISIERGDFCCFSLISEKIIFIFLIKLEDFFRQMKKNRFIPGPSFAKQADIDSDCLVNIIHEQFLRQA